MATTESYNYNTHNISIENADTSESSKREYLSSRLYTLYETAKNAAYVKFNMAGGFIKTKDDLINAFKNGNYELDADSFDGNGNLKGSPLYAFSFVNPLKDEKGYNAALATLKQARQDALDKIAILPIADAFAAFQAFQTTYATA